MSAEDSKEGILKHPDDDRHLHVACSLFPS